MAHDKKFTASEVRSAIGALGALDARDMEYEAGMLDAFADLLEAQERAVPVVTRESAINAIEHVGRYNGPGRETEARQMLVEGPPSAAHRAPSDAKRLAEALRKIVEWQPPAVLSRDGEQSSMLREFGSTGVRDYFRKIAEVALVAHSAQAQPPAASVTDAIAQESGR